MDLLRKARRWLLDLGIGVDADLDPDIQELLESSAERFPHAMDARARAVEAGTAILMLAGAAALALLLPPDAPPSPLLFAVCVLAFAVATRVHFQIGTGFAISTQLVFVPMLFALSPSLAPLAVAAGMFLGYLPGVLSRRTHPDSLLLAPADASYSLAPALVLALGGADAPTMSDWPLYLAALGAQFAFDFILSAVRDRLAFGVSMALQPRLVGWMYVVDALLAPVGLLAALASSDAPYAFLLALSVLALLGFFAQERRARVEHALELGNAYRGTTLLLSDVLEADDEYTGDHSRSVVALALEIAEKLGLDARGRRNVEFGALLHDVGKIAIPKEIINKPGPLDDDEWVVIRTHTIEGQRMLDRVGGVLGEVGQIVRSSHERWDGNGYPDGLAGEQIPLASRIVACADAFNAMTTNRSYRKAMPLPEAVAEVVANAGTQFDPAVAEALVGVVARWGTPPLPASAEGRAAGAANVP